MQAGEVNAAGAEAGEVAGGEVVADDADQARGREVAGGERRVTGGAAEDALAAGAGRDDVVIRDGADDEDGRRVRGRWWGSVRRFMGRGRESAAAGGCAARCKNKNWRALRARLWKISPRLDHLLHFSEGEDADLQFLVGVPISGRVGGAVFDEDEMGVVVLDGGVGGGAAEEARGVAGVAGFLEQFALGGGDDVFTGFDDAAGGFPGEFFDAEAPLAHEDQFLARGEREGLRPVGRFDDVEIAFAPVGDVAQAAALDAEDAAVGTLSCPRVTHGAGGRSRPPATGVRNAGGGSAMKEGLTAS